MRNREGRFYIDSDEEEHQQAEEEEDEENLKSKDFSDSDSSDSSPDSPRNGKPESYNSAWPQSYRQSMDMFGSLTSPGLGFLGTPSISRVSSSFLSSTLRRRSTPEVTPALTETLLPTKAEQVQTQSQSQSQLQSVLTKKALSKKVIHDHHPTSQGSSFGHALINGINVLCGVGILSTPYAIKEGGWLGLCVLFAFALLSCYTGILLRYCLESEEGLQTYPDIGQAAFGNTGRIAVSIILYLELYSCCVEYIILESDNLSMLFPNAHLDIAGFHLTSHHLFAVLTALVVLPTVWLRDLTVLSYISAGGVIASILIVLCLFWVGIVDDVGLHHKGTLLDLSNLPIAIGLYGYCYSGHAVYPNIYTSMKKPSQFTAVLITSFAICTSMYAVVAIGGFMMFGDETKSQFTLNMPKTFVASKIAVWTTVVNPFTKYALTITPVALSLEELLPSTSMKTYWFSIAIRTGLVVSTVVVALTVPFFGFVMALIGSLLTMLVALIVPCVCFLSIVGKKVTCLQAILCISIIILGVCCSAIGTYASIAGIIGSLS